MNKFKTKLKLKIREKLREVFYFRLSTKDQTFFVKRLSLLIKAGIPLQESLLILRAQTTKKGYIIILDTVIAQIANGQSLSTSLGKFKNTFGDFTINLIAFGEESGVLSENLEYIAEELKKKQTLRTKIISASIYPIIVTIATISLTTFLMVYLFPKILPIFNSIKMELPLSTRLVIAISNFTNHYGLVTFFIFIIIIITFIIILKKQEKVHFYFDTFILKIPIIGKIIRDYNLANFTRTMGLLLKSGMNVSDALPISIKTTPNLVYKKELQMLSRVINRGGRISTHLEAHQKLFPDIVTHIIAVGEQSGNLSDSLIYLSHLYEGELDDFTKNISTLIEPVLMIIMGILVGFIAISIITPIYGITQHLQTK